MTSEDPLVFVERDMFEGAPVLTVFHESDGDWQYLTSEDPSPDAAQLVHQSHVYAAAPSLEVLRAMPRGTWAMRSASGEPWVYGVDEDSQG